jgi:hypothetical protein
MDEGKDHLTESPDPANASYVIMDGDENFEGRLQRLYLQKATNSVLRKKVNNFFASIH